MKNLKDLKREQEIHHQQILDNKDEEGRVVININVEKGEDIFSPFESENKIINSELASFLDNQISAIPPKEQLHLKISTENPDAKGAIVNYYRNRFSDVQRRIKSNWFIFGLLAVLTLASLTLLVAIPGLEEQKILYTLMEITSWVFGWETIDNVAFKRTTLKYERQKIISVLNAKISIISHQN